MKAVIDGDAMAFLAAIRAEDTQDWGDGEGAVKSADMKSAIAHLHNYVEDIKTTLAEVGEIIIALGGHGNWRKDLYPQYKANRKGKEPPKLLYACYDYMREHWTTASEPKLEADDMMGIICTSSDEAVLVSPDKDMRNVPGVLYNPRKCTVVEITPAQAFYNHMFQTLVGDSVDNFPGCPRVGQKTALKYIGEYPDYNQKGTKRWAMALWQAVVTAFTEHSQTESDALLMARMAHILTAQYWNGSSVSLWQPPSTWV